VIARLRLRSSTAAGFGIFLLVVLGGGQASWALTPESPTVKAAVKKAVAFLESPAANDTRVGARALVGLVLLKNHAESTHPRIVEAVTAIQGVVKARDAAKVNLDIYSAGLSVIFLVTLDPGVYSEEIGVLLQYLKAKQKPHGGWGYPDKETGDTSMTQYGVLSAWEATQAGFKIPPETIEAVTTWLLKTQDPSGGFGYQGTVAKTGMVKQSEVRHSMVAAGLGSLYICADLLGMSPRVEKRNEDLPMALREVNDQQPAAAANPQTKIEPRRVKDAETAGNRWMGKHHDLRRKEWWTFYYLYAYERYESFRELSLGQPDPEPKWYSDGARYLLSLQDEDGSWTTKDSPAGRTADTAFATLFLLRSSKKSIEKAYGYGDSTLVSGRGLPRQTANLHVAAGKVRPVPKWTTAAELLPILEKRDDDAFEQGIASLGQLPPAEAEILAAKNADLLRGLIADRLPSTRVAAVQAIGKGANLDLVPSLIYALSDPDNDVAINARDALRRLSRSPGPAPIGGELTKSRRSIEIRYWKDWYLAIRPDAEFEN